MGRLDLSTIAYYAFYGGPPLLAIGAWLVGLVLHGLGRSTTLALALVVFAVGLVMGTTLTASLGFLQRQPSLGTVLSAMWLVAVPLVVVIVMAMTGRRRAAGLLLVGVAAPWTVLWGWYVIEILRGADGAMLLTFALFLAGLGPLVIGTALAAAGDPVPLPDPRAPMGRPGSRRPGSMGHRLIAAATYGAVGPSFVFAFSGATIATIALPGQPLLQAAIAIAAVALGTEIELRWIPPAVRPAIEAFHWVGLGELARFREATGEAIPTSRKAFRTWLGRHPESDRTRPWRIEMLTFLGEHAEALAEIQRWTPASPYDALHRASLAAEVVWEQGGPADLPTLMGLSYATGDDGAPERLAADGLIAWWSSRTALAAMDPAWQQPLATFRSRLGAAADGLHATALRKRTFVLPAILAVGLVLLGQLTTTLAT